MQMRGFRFMLDDLSEVNQELAYTSKDVSEKLEALSTNASSREVYTGDDSRDAWQQERVEIQLGEHAEHLVGEGATPNGVLKMLESRPWTSFACDGELEPGRPIDASFNPFKNVHLSLLDILGAHLPIAGLALLAACHTAEQTEGNAHDEALHLTAGMQFCRFRSVIGAMWAMLGEDGPAFAKAFYAIW